MLFSVRALLTEVFQNVPADKTGYITNRGKSHRCVPCGILWKAVKIAHMVFISQSEKQHDLPGALFIQKNPPKKQLNHIHRVFGQ